MKKRSNKLSHAAHIKRHTKGTSNELSFSVLDAAKNALDEGKDTPTEQARRFGRINLFTMPGRKKPPATPVKDQLQSLAGALANPVLPKAPATSLPTPKSEEPDEEELSPAVEPVFIEQAPAEPAVPSFESAPRSSGRTSRDEIAWRKGRRRRRKILAGVASAVIIIALVGAGVWWLYNDNVRYQQNTQQLEQSHDALAATDELLLKLDEALQDPLGESAAAFYEQHESEVQQCLASLDEAEKNATDAAAGLRETLERTAADNLMSASSARRTMFDAGWEILEQAQGMRSAYQQMQDIWQQVLDADAQAREAAQRASSGSRDAISAGKDLEAQAKTKLEETAAELEEFAQENTEVDVSAFQAYVAKRIEALGYAIASDEALEARDTQKATENNDAYNAADEEAAGLAATLPADPGQPVLDAMEELSANAVETYEAARAQASTSDAFLRDYFGSSER